jgi:hypothetical protein
LVLGVVEGVGRWRDVGFWTGRRRGETREGSWLGREEEGVLVIDWEGEG